MSVPVILSAFKAAYDTKNADGIAALFTEKAETKTTGTPVDKLVIGPEPVRQYFATIAAKRTFQELRLDENTLEVKGSENNPEYKIQAAFHSVDLAGNANPPKPVTLVIKTAGAGPEEKIIRFESWAENEVRPA